MSLSPWDLSGNISFDFSLYRPRRPSYVFATQVARRRNESYRHATKSESMGQGDPGIDDFIEGQGGAAQHKKRKDSYIQATDLEQEHIELGQVDINHIGPSIPRGDLSDQICIPHQAGVAPPPSGCGNVIQGPSPTCSKRLPAVSKKAVKAARALRDGPDDGASETIFISTEDAAEMAQSRWKYRKNLIVLSLSFILVFTAFRSIQNLQSSLNQTGRLGVIAMGCVHGTMFLTCLFAPVLINKLTSKWTIVLGLLFYLFWIAANFYPHFYTLIPTSIGVGFGQSLAWGAQVTYIQKLAMDYAHLSKELTHQELAKFNGIFLACFQTTHIWGNVVSSVMLASAVVVEQPQIVGPPTDSQLSETYTGTEAYYEPPVGGMGMEGDTSLTQFQEMPPFVMCGIYDHCEETVPHAWNISNTGIIIIWIPILC